MKKFQHNPYNPGMFAHNDEVSCLLSYVAGGKQDEAQKILQDNPEYMITKGKVTDPSGRELTITPFELAAWNWDVRYILSSRKNYN